VTNDPLERTSTAFCGLDDKQYQAEVALTDKYQAFVTELLRLALLGIAAFGFLYKETFLSFDPARHPGIDITLAKGLASASICFFGATAAFGLVFRYFSSEALRIYMEGLRFWVAGQKGEAEARLLRRRALVYVCIYSKAVAAGSLAIGAGLTALAFVQLLQ
jgi:hypothetical protein